MRKLSPVYLACAAEVLLAAMWVERWWLITPIFSPGSLVFGLYEVSAAAACAAAMVLGMAWFIRRTAIPPEPAQEAA